MSLELLAKKIGNNVVLMGAIASQLPGYLRKKIEYAAKWAEEQEQLERKAKELGMSVKEYLIRQELGIWD